MKLFGLVIGMFICTVVFCVCLVLHTTWVQEVAVSHPVMFIENVIIFNNAIAVVSG